MTTTNSGERKAARRKTAQARSESEAGNNIVHLNAEKARERVRSLTEIARAHPVAAVAGGLVLGLVAGTLVKKGAVGKLARSATALAEVATLAGAALGREALEKVEAAGAAGKDIGRQASEKAGAVSSELLRRGETLTHRAGELLSPAEEAASNAIDAGHRFLNKAADLIQKARG